MERWYVAIDLKSFYASVECVARDLDPLNTHLVVADASRTNKTICLAVTPSLKALGVSGRPRLFEVMRDVERINAWRQTKAGAPLVGTSVDARELAAQPQMALDYIVAPPRMALYMQVSTQIYSIYLRYIAPEDIVPYSVDEVFIDVTPYLRTYNRTPQELARFLIRKVLEETGITATAGVGSNLYLAKVAMDILAKRMPADEYGVRLAMLDERQYRKLLWEHRPITDFWRVGRGTARRLERLGLYTMGDIARCSEGADGDVLNEERLYKTFGINAELLIDHAWGWEPVTLAEIKQYRPQNNSFSSGQVLQEPYSAEKARLVTLEMAEAMALDLVRKGLVTDQLVLTVGYDVDNLKPGHRYQGEIHIDHYGRAVPKHAHGTANLEGRHTSSSHVIIQATAALYDRIVDPSLLVRRITLNANHVVREEDARAGQRQQTLFDTVPQEVTLARRRERIIQETILTLKARFGKNAVLRATSLEEGATARLRNAQIGGHKA